MNKLDGWWRSPDRDALTTEEVARIEGVTTRRIRQICAAGEIPEGHKVDRVWMIEPRYMVVSPRFQEIMGTAPIAPAGGKKRPSKPLVEPWVKRRAIPAAARRGNRKVVRPAGWQAIEGYIEGYDEDYDESDTRK